jgi:hypothetical protein
LSRTAKGRSSYAPFGTRFEKVTILDPACGSGAFLFASLNILEPLYDACLDRMEAFVEDLERSGEKHSPEKFSDFRRVLENVAEHPNRSYFIFKSIILNNLYGVDIMEEAVEICKLRLFLKLAAQVDPNAIAPNFGIEPLPDIDFNIRAGNSLVGFAAYQEVEKALTYKMDFDNSLERIDTAAADLQQAFDAFRRRQVQGDGTVPAEDKTAVRSRLNALDIELNDCLARDYGVNAEDEGAVSSWRTSHQPFHWFVEFYGIMRRGGFDVVIGNPPYVASSKVNYLSREMRRIGFPDIYAYFVLRALALCQKELRCGMIVPLSLMFSEDFGQLRKAVCKTGGAWLSSFDNIPASVFEGVSQRCTIWLSSDRSGQFSSPMYRWRSVARPRLVPSIAFTPFDVSDVGTAGIPKWHSRSVAAVVNTVVRQREKRNSRVLAVARGSGAELGFSPSARNFITTSLHGAPSLDAITLNTLEESGPAKFHCASTQAAEAGLASTSGELYFLYWLVRGDGFHVTTWIIRDYLRCLEFLPTAHFELLARLGSTLDERRFEALVFKKNAGKYVGNFNYRGHYFITRRADLLVMAGLGVSVTGAFEVFDQVQRVLSINEHAGEKSIPNEVKALFPPSPVDASSEEQLFAQVDGLLVQHGFTTEGLDFLFNHDIHARLGRDFEDD